MKPEVILLFSFFLVITAFSNLREVEDDMNEEERDEFERSFSERDNEDLEEPQEMRPYEDEYEDFDEDQSNEEPDDEEDIQHEENEKHPDSRKVKDFKEKNDKESNFEEGKKVTEKEDNEKPEDNKINEEKNQDREDVQQSPPDHVVNKGTDPRKVASKNMINENMINQANGAGGSSSDEEFDDDEDERNAKRGAIELSVNLWPTGTKLKIPYTISSKFSAAERNKIRRIIGVMNGHLKCNSAEWIPRNGQKNYVKFVKGDGCSSHVGKKKKILWWGGSQDIKLHSNCLKYNDGITLHEMLHAMGMSHEQSREDRDSYVTIHTGNVKKGKSHNFEKRRTLYGSHMTPYEYKSVMHYGLWDFSKNGKKTITVPSSVPLSTVSKIGQRTGMSAQDITEINRLYKCPGYTPLLPSNYRRRRRRRRLAGTRRRRRRRRRRIWGDAPKN